jgi:hypothetical protein
VDKVAITIGVLLIALGIGGYAGSGYVAPTALIPAYFGVVLAVLGVVVAVKPTARKHAMHAAAAIALLGALAAGGRLVVSLSHGGHDRLALFSLVSMTVLCVLFVILAVRSFIAARKARQAGAAGAA